MSNAIEIKINEQEYNGLHGALQQFHGLSSALAATKVQEAIVTAAQTGAVDVPAVPATDDKPAVAAGKQFPWEIVISIEKRTIDALTQGLKDLAAKEKIAVSELLQLKAIASLIKIAGRFSNWLEKEFEKVASIDEALDTEIDSEPLDGEVK